MLSANTLVLSYEHFWTDQVSTQLALGIPPRHKLQGTGSLATAGVIGDGQQLSPAVLVKYNFGEAEQRLRPYIGAGLNYTWFRKAHITNDSFRQATYGPAATTELSVSPSWNPVYNVGMNYRLDERWSVGLSVAYAPLKTRITVAADNTSFGAPVKVVTDVRIRTLAIGMNLGYRF